MKTTSCGSRAIWPWRWPALILAAWWWSPATSAVLPLMLCKRWYLSNQTRFVSSFWNDFQKGAPHRCQRKNGCSLSLSFFSLTGLGNTVKSLPLHLSHGVRSGKAWLKKSFPRKLLHFCKACYRGVLPRRNDAKSCVIYVFPSNRLRTSIFLDGKLSFLQISQILTK